MDFLRVKLIQLKMFFLLKSRYLDFNWYIMLVIYKMYMIFKIYNKLHLKSQLRKNKSYKRIFIIGYTLLVFG